MTARTGTVLAHSRLHFGLVDVGTATRRRYGGAGLVLRDPSTSVRWTADDLPVRVTAAPTPGRGPELVEEATVCLRRLSASAGRALLGHVHVAAGPGAHVGHGSKTSALLGVLIAASLANDLPLDPNALMRASGRGGTSGVGVHGTFGGGFVVDGGHPQSDHGFAPSSAGPPPRSPLLLHRLAWPADWTVALVRLPDLRGRAGAPERSFFAAHAPVPRGESLAALAAVHHGLVPAVLTADLDALAHALGDLNATGFKRREIDAQPAAVRALLQDVAAARVPTGMSSLGPLVYAVVNVADTAQRADIERIAASTGATVTWTRASATGHDILPDGTARG